MLRWYLIYTKPSGELIAQSNLERQNYEVYFPRVVQPVRRCGQWSERVVALFRRYLFLRLDAGQQPLGPVRSSTGVASVVRFGSEYAVVPEQVVRDLRGRADPQTGLHRLNRGPLFTHGTAVKIRACPFDGLDGVFECEAGAHRAVVLLKLLGQDLPVRISMEYLVPGHAY